MVNELRGGKSMPVYCGCRCAGGLGGGNIRREFGLLSWRVNTGDRELDSRLSGIDDVD